MTKFATSPFADALAQGPQERDNVLESLYFHISGARASNVVCVDLCC